MLAASGGRARGPADVGGAIAAMSGPAARCDSVGTYTQIARLGAHARGRAMGYQSPPARSQTSAASAPPRFECAGCGDGADVRERCPRCDVPMRPRGGAVEVRPTQTQAETAPPSLARESWGLGMGLGLPALLLALGVPAAARVGARVEDIGLGFVLAALALALWAGFLVAARAPHLLGRIARAARRIRARGRRARSGAHEAVRGRVRVEDGEVTVLHSGGPLRVPVSARVRVYDDRGEVSFLADGDEVEVVGTLREEPVGAGAYRAGRGVPSLDPDRPIDIWLG